jgi:hypothetical protein
MLVQSREAKVFVALAISMTVGVIILHALGNNPPSAGAFCLSRYTRLVSTDEAILTPAAQPTGVWKNIEIYYSKTTSGNIQQLAFLNGLADPEDINCHYVICNGHGGGDGQIKPTQKWRTQQPVTRSWLNPEPQDKSTGQTIFICVIADKDTALPTKRQIKMTAALVKGLCRKFNIKPDSIRYPAEWKWYMP